MMEMPWVEERSLTSLENSVNGGVTISKACPGYAFPCSIIQFALC